LTNPGTIRAGSVVDNGATIVGNAPTVIGGGAGFAIHSLQVGSTAAEVFARPAAVGSRDLQPHELRLTWVGLPSARFAVELSLDLLTWRQIEAWIVSPTAGRFEAIVPLPQLSSGFFRIVEVPAPPTPSRPTRSSEDKLPSAPSARPIYRP
jgi:hypothetical protein